MNFSDYSRSAWSYFLAGVSFFLFAGCASVGMKPQPDKAELSGVPEEYREGIEERMEWAGENREEVITFLNMLPPEELWAGWFTAANLPPRDLGIITAEELSANHRLAFRARSELPWGKAMPDSHFLHYVLPYHVSQEPVQSWRSALYEELRDRVKEISDMKEAALEINRWAAEKIKFKQTEFRDQGPLTSIRHGIGRCEEMMILYIAAARTVCIPARPCSTPWWPFTDNNHAWVEVWCDGKWYSLGAAEPAPTLSEAWFSKSAQRAVMVRSIGFGVMDQEKTEERIYRTGDDFTIINSTPVYTDPCEIEVQVYRDEEPSVDTAVYLSVFNYGVFRAVAAKKTDDAGIAEFVAGPGQMLITAGDDELKAMQVVTASPEKTVEVTFDLAEQYTMPETLWLHYPLPEGE